MSKQDWQDIADPVARAQAQISQGGTAAVRITEGVPAHLVIFRVTDSRQTATLYTPYLPQQAIRGFATLEDAIAWAEGHEPATPGRFLILPKEG